MMHPVFLVTLAYFSIGAAATAAINRRTGSGAKRQAWTKYAVYFVVVHAVILCVLAGGDWFAVAASSLAVLGFFEIVRVSAATRECAGLRRCAVLATYSLLAVGFVHFGLSGRPQPILFVYLVVLAFDGFSQVTGQLAGRHLLAPRVSPHKTVEGLAGGFAFGLLSALLARDWIGADHAEAVGLAALLCASAAAGDLGASWFKRMCHVRDFGRLLPGHGGILDRFDGFMAAGCAYWASAGGR
jgi:phosphatidate cytidylyltransferase